MAPSRKKATNSRPVVWKSTHIDNILVHELMRLSKQDLKQENAMKDARYNGAYNHIDLKDLLAEYVIGEWIEGIIFKRKGKRYIIEEDADLCSNKCALFPWCRRQIGARDRHYHIKPHRTLDQIDRTAKKMVALRKTFSIFRHKNEKGWFLSQSDPHHFLKFPLGRCYSATVESTKLTLNVDIMVKILGYIVEVPGAAVAPSVVKCNWKKLWIGGPSFTIHTDSPSYISEREEKTLEFPKEYVIATPTKDKDGSLTVLRRVHEPELNGSILRACKSLNNIGRNLLYGHNRYKFMMNNSTLQGSPPSWIGKEDWYVPAEKPYTKDYDCSTRGFHNRINRGIADIRKHVTIKNLAGWVFHDPFLSVLYIIGPKNAALVRILEFSGEVRCHQCARGHFCDDCILDSLRVYIPFINKLCPNVHKLILTINEYHNDEESAILEQKLTKFLEGDIRYLENITELVVNDFSSSRRHIAQTSAASLAEPTIKYFRDRAVLPKIIKRAQQLQHEETNLKAAAEEIAAQ